MTKAISLMVILVVAYFGITLYQAQQSLNELNHGIASLSESIVALKAKMPQE